MNNNYNHKNILAEIVASKQEDIRKVKETFSLEDMKQEAFAQKKTAPARDFVQAITQKVQNQENAIIAEIKKASPSKGVICENLSIEKVSKAYEKNGATCISVLTDIRYFQGAPLYLRQARIYSSLPLLRKDFIIDEYQIYESKMMGADAILLIADILSAQQMQDFEALANQLEMSVLPEIHHPEHFEKVRGLKTSLLGVNNRNLENFMVDLNTTLEMQKLLLAENLQRIIISESGFKNAADLAAMNQKGIYSFLIGEHFMSKAEPGKALAEILLKN